jgi:Zn finger protein HypA/HybF involved in hydrogenase expression
MLEVIIVQKIIDIVEQVMDGNGVDKCLVIHISIEKMSLLTPGLLQSRFATLTENTRFADTVLDVKSTPVVNHCENCSQIFASEDLVSNCIYCGWEYPRPVFGGSMKIEGIEVLDDGS